MSRPTSIPAGFSLVEVTLALGVAAFCLVAILGLLPLGVHTNQTAASQTAAASVLSSVVADLRATPKTSLISSQYGIPFGTEKTLFFDEQGQPVIATDPSGTPRYRVTITAHSSTGGAFAPTFVGLKVSWPALADPATTEAIGFR